MLKMLCKKTFSVHFKHHPVDKIIIYKEGDIDDIENIKKILGLGYILPNEVIIKNTLVEWFVPLEEWREKQIKSILD